MAKKKAEKETLAERLRRMAQTDIRAVDRDTLVERSIVKLDPELSRGRTYMIKVLFVCHGRTAA